MADQAPLNGRIELNYIAAVNAALRRALADRPEVVVYGEDVGVPGGVFGATRGLRAEFGDRVFDTPISESSILGSAIGAAMVGMRPVVEIMWIEFMLVAFDQIVNQAANIRYVSNGLLSAPITVRTQQGVLAGSCAQHSQSLEGLIAHIPGIRVALPSNPQDAYTILLQAIACDDPVIVIESRSLYFGDRVPIDPAATAGPIGGAHKLRDGTDVTIATWSTQVSNVMQGVSALAADGISADVIDQRWLNPLDLDTVLASVEKTSRLLIVHEANVTGGFGAEIAARVADTGFRYLDAPIRRLGVPDSRIPAAPALQRSLVPDAGRVANAVRDLMSE